MTHGQGHARGLPDLPQAINQTGDAIDSHANGVNRDAWAWHSAVAGSELKFYQTNTPLGCGTSAPVANADILTVYIPGQAVPEPTTLALTIEISPSRRAIMV